MQVPLFDNVSGLPGLRILGAAAFAGLGCDASLLMPWDAHGHGGHAYDEEATGAEAAAVVAESAKGMGVEALALARAAREASWAHLMGWRAGGGSREDSSGEVSGMNSSGSSSGSGQKFVLVGGKGGVGKTSTAAALALACAESVRQQRQSNPFRKLSVGAHATRASLTHIHHHDA